MDNVIKPVASSFRDPGGQVYFLNNDIYRQVNEPSYSDYTELMKSGLYDRLISLQYLIPHVEVTKDFAINEYARVVLKPDKVNFISYPYEWCFSQLKNAALLTLDVTKIALEYNMILKDATAYNVQFHKSKPILVDTCSFEVYEDGEPWIAYNQFCKHFLAPLVLMSQRDIRLNSFFKQYIDGVPLDLASKILPLKSWFSFSLLAHIHIHAKSQAKYSDSGLSANTTKIKRTVSKNGLLGILDNLRSYIDRLNWCPIKTEWGDYYDKTNYSDVAVTQKVDIVEQLIFVADPKTIWDLGGNNGFYSRVASKKGASVVSFDIDPVAVETNYIKVMREDSKLILPLLQDLTNPSSDIGWAHNERDSLKRRGPVDLIMALALIHHLAISNNVPLKRIAEYFSSLGEYLLIEFVPKEDSQVQRLLSSREDVFDEYSFDGFRHAFAEYYDIVKDFPITDSSRRIYLMKKKKS